MMQQMGDLKMAEFTRHVEDANTDFKESIMKKVEIIKLQDTQELQKRIDTIKKEEKQVCIGLNKEYIQRELVEEEILNKFKAKKHLLMRIVAQWETNKRKRQLFSAWKNRMQQKHKDHLQGEYCNAFYQQGLVMRGMKAFKLYA